MNDLTAEEKVQVELLHLAKLEKERKDQAEKDHKISVVLAVCFTAPLWIPIVWCFGAMMLQS